MSNGFMVWINNKDKLEEFRKSKTKFIVALLALSGLCYWLLFFITNRIVNYNYIAFDDEAYAHTECDFYKD